MGMQVSKDSLIEGIKDRRGMGQLLQEMESVCVCGCVRAHRWGRVWPVITSFLQGLFFYASIKRLSCSKDPPP